MLEGIILESILNKVFWLIPVYCTIVINKIANGINDKIV